MHAERSIAITTAARSVAIMLPGALQRTRLVTAASCTHPISMRSSTLR
ncbi:MAG: hypothetical protein GY938_00560 [Ketobacter sp.]|nr:hypothetical protein [Ketobacter sp.]